MQYNKYCGKMIYRTQDNYLATGMCVGMGMGVMLSCIVPGGMEHIGLTMIIGLAIGELIGAMIPVKVATDSEEMLEHLEPENENLEEYLQATQYIDFEEEIIQQKAWQLQEKPYEKQMKKKNVDSALFDLINQNMSMLQYGDTEVEKQIRQAYARQTNQKISGKSFRATMKAWERYKTDSVKACYEYVRDEIAHSLDVPSTVWTTSASSVLQEQTGICHAKANLLAALCRCLKVPAGICYQHLTLAEDETKGYCLHAYNAVYLCHEWLLMDARENKPGVAARFPQDGEVKLAFPVRQEYDEYYVPWIYLDADQSTMERLDQENHT